MTQLDWLLVAVVVIAALAGLGSGLVVSALSVAGFMAGALLGAELAPHLLHEGSRSPYTPLVALGCAVVLALVLSSLGRVIGARVRAGLRLTPLRAVDSLGGLVFGAAAGLAVVWIAAAVAMNLPGQLELRRGVQRSLVVGRLNEIAPPARVLDVLARVDPLPVLAGPLAPVAPPDPALLDRPGVRRAAPSVVRVRGTACGLGIAGSGWVAAHELVVTAAHVVAGEDDTVVEAPGSRPLRATAVAFDTRNDVALLRVRGLEAPPLRLVEPDPGAPVVVLGYPLDGPFTATPGRIGRTVVVISEDAYGHSPVRRTITSLRARVQHGNSGGPAVDALGAVQATVFASSRDGERGFAVPDDPVRDALEGAGPPVSTGPCA